MAKMTTLSKLTYQNDKKIKLNELSTEQFKNFKQAPISSINKIWVNYNLPTFGLTEIKLPTCSLKFDTLPT